MNKRIEALIKGEHWEEAWNAITVYEKENPEDADIDVYRFLCTVSVREYEAALGYAKRAVKCLPYSPDAHYNYAYICQLCENLYEAYEQYGIALELALGGNPYQFDVSELQQQMQGLLEIIVLDVEHAKAENAAEKKQQIDYLMQKSDLGWEIGSSVFHSNYPIVNSEYMDYMQLPKLYATLASASGAWKIKTGNYDRSSVYSCIEMQRSMAEMYQVSMETEKEIFLPIVLEKDGYLSIKVNGEEAVIPNMQPKQYVNYRIPKGKVAISSKESFRIGTVVPIEHMPERKRLVLNIFIDGLSQMILQESFPLLMPHTYKFFNQGMVCKNAYTSGDWTFPSIASVVTGQTLAKHKMLHSKLLRKLDEDVPILFEYFDKAGYNTTKIGGNWRITPNYGYARGMNRVFYQNHYNGYSAETIVSETIEQMHFMRETDQFIWMEIGELHMIADGVNLGSFVGELSFYENQEKQEGINSVRQEYNATMIKYYKKQIEKVDRKLAALYQYIEEEYEENDILIALFADHGQGYLVKPEEEFLSQGRSKVAFMVRGNGLSGETEEIVSTCDYAPILCSLSGIPFSYHETNAHLPAVFGGTEEREFAITESIHVGDPYQISLNGKDFTFYFISEEVVNSECRIPLKNYRVRLVDSGGRELEDLERKTYYTNYCLKHIAPCVVFDN